MAFSTEKVSFKNADGHTLDARLELPDGQVNSYAIFVHCFTCSKQIHAATRISRALTEAGIAVLRFDFTGLGNSDGDFSNTNFSTTVADVISAYDHMVQAKRVPELLIGHSLGGATVLAVANSLPTIRGIVTINAPSDVRHVEHLFKEGLSKIEQTGSAEVSLSGRSFIIRKQFLDDIRSIRLEDKLSKIKASVLIFHAPLDEVVDISHAASIYQGMRSPRSFICLEEASHLLDRKEDSDFVSRIISAWGLRYLVNLSCSLHLSK